jgi:hypothetical protein
VPDYVRCSIYSIRLDAPSTSKQDFSKEIGIMTNVFDTLDYKHQYRKYNAFQAGDRLMKSTDLPQVSDDEAMAIATINGNKKANDDDKYAAQILKYLNDKKVGRENCEKKWRKLTTKEKEACIAATPTYVASTPDKQFRKNPLSYLNQKAWNDEIIPRNNGTDKPSLD